MVGVVMKQTPHDCGNGVQRVYTFPKGTKLSAVKTDFSYGGDKDLWEIAVFDADDNFITTEVWYDLDDDVMGFVTDDQLKQYIDDVYYWDLED